jgi:DNA-binding PadR family transcriptional regulator
MVALTPLAISVLALLNERPMHPYEMVQTLLDRKEDRIVKVRPGSLYHTVERLAAAGLIEAAGTERAGNRPERTTYAITEPGRDALVARITELLSTPVNEFPVFPFALSQADNLTATEVVRLLHNRLGELDAAIDDLTQIIATVRQDGLLEAYWLVADYLLATLTAERDWIARTTDRIESKDLEWPTR